MAARRALELPRLHEGAHALLDEERVAARPLEHALAHVGQARVRADELTEEILGLLAVERGERELGEVAPRAPVVDERRPVRGDHHEGNGPEPLDEGVHERAGCRVQPVQVLDHEEDRPGAHLGEQDAAQRVQDTP